MVKRSSDSDTRTYGSEDDPIGLTQAFAPITEDSYDHSDGIGLTQAFGPVGDEQEWAQGRDKWAGFNWDAPIDGGDDAESGNGNTGEEAGELAVSPDEDPDGAKEESPSASDGKSLGEAADDESQDESDDDDDDASERPRGRHAAAVASGFGFDDEEPQEDDASDAAEGEAAPVLTKKQKRFQERARRSKRSRRVLIVVAILLVGLIGAMGYYSWQLFNEGQSRAVQQTHTTKDSDASAISGTANEKDATKTVTRTADVPDLSELLGLSQDEAVEKLKRGATITSSREVNESGSQVKMSSTVALTTEPADSKTGTPSVYLGVDADGKVVQAGYSASATALGFGSLSFIDAVSNEHVIEKTLAAVGVDVSSDQVVLPSDKSAYTTYASDGKTTVRERCSFSGDVTVNSTPCNWSSVLSYDYTTANLTGNVADTVRVIYAYVTVTPPPESSAESAPAE